MAKLIMTKVCRTCGREYYWKTVERGKILDIEFRVEMTEKCPYCGGKLDYNFHKVADSGDARPVRTYVRRCPKCGLEVKLMKIQAGNITEYNEEAEKLVFCPVCGGRMTIEMHTLVI